MLHNPKILFVGDYNRKDYVQLLESSKDYCKLYFLFYSSPSEELNCQYESYGEAIYWKDFTSAQQLLSFVNPNKVVFLYIESYNHVVLNLACKEAGIPTYLLEHGLRADYVFGFDPIISPNKENTIKKRLVHFYHFLRDFRARVKTRVFLNNSISLLNSEDRYFALKFIKIRGKYNYLEAFRKIKSEKRLADHYIGFSNKIYETFKEHEAPYFGGKVKFIGIPYFDKLALLPSAPLTRSILLIDQPLAEQGLLKWDIKYKTAFAQGLSSVCQEHQYQLLVKPHPKQDLYVWQELERQKKCCIISDEDLLKLASSIPIVVGFYSTYLMPFAAYTHTTVLTFERHPAGKYLVSEPLIKAGVATPFYTFEGLSSILSNLKSIHLQQFPNKAKFAQEWMYKFDGKSGERLRDILLED